MDVALSDLLTCPRCGPMYGLVLLPYEVTDRRVRSGVLGCANCRERYPVEAGVADLRAGADDEETDAAAGSAGDEAAGAAWGSPASESRGSAGGAEAPEVRLAGLMGLAEAHGTVLLAGPASVHAAALAALVEGVEVVTRIGPEPIGSTSPAGPGVSRMRLDRVLPFRSGSLRGVALTGASAGLLAEGARVLGGEGRLVVDPAPEAARARLEAAGLYVVAEEGRVVVASRRP